MKTFLLTPCALTAGAAVFLAGCEKKNGGHEGHEHDEHLPVSESRLRQAADGSVSLVLDAETQKRIALEIASLAPATPTCRLWCDCWPRWSRRWCGWTSPRTKPWAHPRARVCWNRARRTASLPPSISARRWTWMRGPRAGDSCFSSRGPSTVCGRARPWSASSGSRESHCAA